MAVHHRWSLVLLLLLVGCSGTAPVPPESSAPTAQPSAQTQRTVAPSVTTTISALDAAASTTTASEAANAVATAVTAAPTEPPYDPNAQIVALRPRPQGTNLAQQLAVSPPEGGAGMVARCFNRVKQLGGQPGIFAIGMRAEDVIIDKATFATICYSGFKTGTLIEETITDPNGQVIRNVTFDYEPPFPNFDVDATDRWALPEDVPGTYMVRARTPDGEFTTTYEVTDQISENPFVTNIAVLGRGTSASTNTISETAYIFVQGFEPGAALDLFFYEACIPIGQRRAKIGGRRYITSGAVRVNGQGQAFITVPPDIAASLEGVKHYIVRAVSPTGQQESQGRFVLTDPLALQPAGQLTFVGSTEGIQNFSFGIDPCPPPTSVEAPATVAMEVQPGRTTLLNTGTRAVLVAADTLFAEESAQLVAHDLINQQVRWHSDQQAGGSGLFNSTMLLAGDTLYRLGINELGAYDTATGELRWQQQISDRDSLYSDDGRVLGPALLADGDQLYVATIEGTLLRLSPIDGQIAEVFTTPVPWNSQFLGLDVGGPIMRASLAVHDDVAYIAGEDGALHAIDIKRGTELWRTPLEKGASAPPTIAGNTVFVGSYGGYLYALDAATGNTRWTFPLGDWTNSLVVTNNTIFASVESGALYAIDPATGKARWRYSSDAWMVSGPFASDSGVYVVTSASNPEQFRPRDVTVVGFGIDASGNLAPEKLPTVSAVTPNTTPFPVEAFTAALGSAGGEFGAVVTDLGTGQQAFAQNADLVFSAASLIKLPIALTVYDLAAQGQLGLDEHITLRTEDIVGGTGSLQHEEPGRSYSIRELSTRMIRESDNTAGNLILNRIGFDAVNATATQLGAAQTRVQRLFLDLDALAAGRDNLTSPADMALILERLSDDTYQEIRAAMEQNVDRARVPALLPAEAVVANKTGTLPGIEHDVAIVSTGTRRYSIVLMGRNLPDSQAAIDAMAQASHVIYDWFAE